jgi:L,D-transpeptidase ErfK/SrfK
MKFEIMSIRRSFSIFILSAIFASASRAETFILPPPDVDLIGHMQVVKANQEDTLMDIARRYSLGYDEIIHANPGVNRWMPGNGTPVVLPTRYILPNTPRQGVVLNLPEMRLYYYPEAKPGEVPVVKTYPVSVGRMDWKTPLGKTTIVRKQKDPAWYPPESIKKEHAADGDPLPDVVPAGPDNPLGRYALRLGKAGYLIHSTNKPYGVGMRVTHGCVRMYPEDIEQLFPEIPVGTEVRIIKQPVKVGQLAGAFFMETHEPLEEDDLPREVSLDQAMNIAKARVGDGFTGVDPVAVQLVVEQASGIPVDISRVGQSRLSRSQ